MFSGIIETLGKVLEIDVKAGKQFTLAYTEASSLKKGASMAINGVCTTVTESNESSFTCFATKETLAITNLNNLKVGDLVNLESSLTLGAKIDGHLVYGHIDTMLPLLTKVQTSASWIFKFAIQSEHRPYLIAKGPIALNGISLTLYEIGHDFLSVMIIPHTYQHTNFHTLAPNDLINVEFDTLPKYLQNLLPSYLHSKSI